MEPPPMLGVTTHSFRKGTQRARLKALVLMAGFVQLHTLAAMIRSYSHSRWSAAACSGVCIEAAFPASPSIGSLMPNFEPGTTLEALPVYACGMALLLQLVGGAQETMEQPPHGRWLAPQF